jgi:hypothetical protein
MTEDPTGEFYYGYLAEHFPQHCLLAVDVATGEPVAKAHSVPLAYDGTIADGVPSGGSRAAAGWSDGEPSGPAERQARSDHHPDRRVRVPAA